jgi:hypothetical protein
MAVGTKVEEYLQEASSNLRNALAFAARGERPLVCNSITKLLLDVEHIMTFDELMDVMEDAKNNV